MGKTGLRCHSVMRVGVMTGLPVAQDEAVLDDVIDRLLEVRAGRPGRQVQLSEQEVKQLCLTAKEIFMSQPNLLELEAPIKICGMKTTSPEHHKHLLDVPNGYINGGLR